MPQFTLRNNTKNQNMKFKKTLRAVTPRRVMKPRPSEEHRACVIYAYKNGNTMLAISKILNIENSMVQSILSRYWKTGDTDTEWDIDELSIFCIGKWYDQGLTFQQMVQNLYKIFKIHYSISTVPDDENRNEPILDPTCGHSLHCNLNRRMSSD